MYITAFKKEILPFATTWIPWRALAEWNNPGSGRQNTAWWHWCGIKSIRIIEVGSRMVIVSGWREGEMGRCEWNIALLLFKRVISQDQTHSNVPVVTYCFVNLKFAGRHVTSWRCFQWTKEKIELCELMVMLISFIWVIVLICTYRETLSVNFKYIQFLFVHYMPIN